MEIRQHGVDNAKAMARQYQQARPCRPSPHAVSLSGAFEHADTRGAHRNDPSTTFSRRVDRIRGRSVNAIPLALHLVLRRISDAHGAKGMEPNVQRDKSGLHAATTTRV